jgi:hypothetical protein
MQDVRQGWPGRSWGITLDQLSTYELLALWITYGADAGQHFMNFLAMFTAYLVAAYLAADKVGLIPFVTLSALYVIVVGLTAAGIWITLHGVIDIATEILVRDIRSAPGFSAMAKPMAGAAGVLFAVLNVAIELLACIGSVAFACARRKRLCHPREPELAGTEAA